MGKYVCFSGDLILSDKLTFTEDNRAFNYGDGLFETIRCRNSEPLFFNKHYQRIRNGLYTLNIELSEEYSQKFFEFQINKLLQKNRIYQGARVRLTIFRDSGGLFTPSNNKAHFLISASPLKNEKYELNKTGLNIGIYNEVPILPSALSQFKTLNALTYIMAGIWKHNNRFDDCILINHRGFLVEAVSSNVFCVIQDKLITPAIETGCVNGIMRSTVFQIASEMKIPVMETEKLNKKVLQEADEVFFTNSIQGIAWVGAFGDRRYFHNIASRLLERLNTMI